MDMDNETALELVKHGATLLLLDVPEYTLLGIDTQVFSVGPLFKGIKMIPPGTHFLYYSSSNREGSQFSPIVGSFIYACPSQVIVRKWNQQEERLVKLLEDEDQDLPPELYTITCIFQTLSVILEEGYCQAVKNMEFDRHLGPYSLSHFGDWIHLSSYIDKSTIDRIEPIGGEITVACEPDLLKNITKTSMENALAQQLKNSKFTTLVNKSAKRSCYYTSIPRFIKQKGLPGQELTSLNIDKTQLLENILLTEFKGSEDLLLGELQFSFIAFLMGQSLESFLQWKSLVSLFLGCTDAPFHTRAHLFTKFIKVIYSQLKYGLEKEHTDASDKFTSIMLDDSWFSADSFLYHLCKEFFSLFQDCSVVDGDLLNGVRRLRELLERTWGLNFQQNSVVDGAYFEDDEYAPVVEMVDDAV